MHRILGSAFAVGIEKWGPAPQVDMARDSEIALDIARRGIVLLKQRGAFDCERKARARNLYVLPSSPVAHLQKLLPTAQIEFDGAYTPAGSAMLARIDTRAGGSSEQ